MQKPRHLWLLGLSGSGKSTIGPCLARALAMPWVDTDTEITRLAGKSIPEIFHQEGEDAFRDTEAAVLEKVAAGPASVVSCGGGIVLRESNRKILKSAGNRIYLRSDPATLARRLHSAQDRPLVTGNSPEAVLHQQLAQRGPWYEECEIQIDVTRLTPEEVVSGIRQKLPSPWSR